MKGTLLLAIGAMAVLAGCAPMASLHPLIPADSGAPVDRGYLGVWKDCHDEDIWKIEAAGERAYRYQKLDKGNDRGRFRLAEFGGRWFADIEPDGGVVPGHIMAKIRLDGDRIALAFASLAAAKALPHETLGSGDSEQIVLTASTDELKKYLLRVRDQAEAFEKEDLLCRVK